MLIANITRKPVFMWPDEEKIAMVRLFGDDIEFFNLVLSEFDTAEDILKRLEKTEQLRDEKFTLAIIEPSFGDLIPKLKARNIECVYWFIGLDTEK